MAAFCKCSSRVPDHANKSERGELFTMSAIPVNTPPEVLSQPMDGSRAEQIYRDHLERRGRKIARIGRLWNERKLLGRFAAIGAAAALLIALLIPSRYASTT